MDWFLYDNDFRHESVKSQLRKTYKMMDDKIKQQRIFKLSIVHHGGVSKVESVRTLKIDVLVFVTTDLVLYGKKYSRMDQVKFVEDSFCPSNFLKAVFHKFYFVYILIFFPIYSIFLSL